MGEGDYDVEEWSEAVEDARDNPDERRADAFLNIPLLGDYLEEGLAELGLSCNDVNLSRL